MIDSPRVLLVLLLVSSLVSYLGFSFGSTFNMETSSSANFKKQCASITAAHCQTGFALKDFQKQAIERAMSKHPVTVVSVPTGSGKSCIFTLLPKFLGMAVLVISPLLGLIEDTLNNINDKYTNIRAIQLGSETVLSQLQRDIDNGSVDVVLATPESYLARPTLNSSTALHNKLFGAVVIDEAQDIVLVESTFRGDFVKMCKSSFSNLVLLSGSLTTNVERELLTNYFPHVAGIKQGFQDKIYMDQDRKNLYHSIIQRKSLLDFSPLNWILTLMVAFKDMPDEFPCIMIYFRTVNSLVAGYSWLRDKCPTVFQSRVSKFHANIADISHRNNVVRKWSMRGGHISVVEATGGSLGKGINKPDLKCVIFWGSPQSIEDYIQGAGRAARDISLGMGLTFLYWAQSQIPSEKLRESSKKKGKIAKCIDDSMLDLLFRTKGDSMRENCIRKCMLEKFDVQYEPSTSKTAECCSVCSAVIAEEVEKERVEKERAEKEKEKEKRTRGGIAVERGTAMDVVEEPGVEQEEVEVEHAALEHSPEVPQNSVRVI